MAYFDTLFNPQEFCHFAIYTELWEHLKMDHDLTLSEKRSRSGRKGGYAKRGKISKKTQDKLMHLNELRAEIETHTLSLLDAAMFVALGTVLVYRMEETMKGKEVISRRHILVTDEKEKKEAFTTIGFKNDLNSRYIFITTVQPNIRAIQLLFDRAFGRPTEYKEHRVKGPLESLLSGL